MKILWRKNWELIERQVRKGKKFIEFEIPFSKRLLVYYNNPKFNILDRYYSGTFMGPVNQGLAWDVFASALRRLYRRKRWDVVIPAHDEVLTEVPIGSSFEEFKKIMTETPSFLPKERFPRVDCSFWRGYRYLK